MAQDITVNGTELTYQGGARQKNSTKAIGPFPRRTRRNLRRTLSISTVRSGFYEGFNPAVGVTSKAIVLFMVFCLTLFPEQSGAILRATKQIALESFAGWYIYLLAAFLVFCAVIATLPVSGRARLGPTSSRPTISTSAWLAMMFCAGIGVGILTFSVSEPVSHFHANPDMMAGTVALTGPEAVTTAVRFAYLHWGLSAWACYAIVGLALGLACHKYGQPLTMRSGLVSLFGHRLEGPIGHAIDTISVLAITSGITTTIVLGLEQICSGLSILTGSSFFADSAGNAPLTGLLTALVVATAVAIASVVSGVERGVKWISQIGVLLAGFILITFVVAGSDWQVVSILVNGTVEYLTTLPAQIMTLYDPAQSQLEEAQRGWQDNWTIFYWAWWVAFAPFVGLFLTRISYGRTVREFLFGAILAPTAMCFVWFAGTGGTALLLEVNGQADGSILGAEHAFRIYQTIDILLSPALAAPLKAVLVLLFLFLIVASATAAIIAIKSIGSAGNEDAETPAHSILWAFVIAAVTAAILAVGGIELIRDVMIIGALPFSIVMALMMVGIGVTLFSADPSPNA